MKDIARPWIGIPVTKPPAIAFVPTNTRPPRNLSQMPLNALKWPLGQPERLENGTVADMEAQDHLVVYPRTNVWRLNSDQIPPKLSIAIMEPRAYHWRHMRLAEWLNHRFSAVLTSDERLLTRLPNALFVPYGTTWVPGWQSSVASKTRNVSLIASEKRSLSGHKLRHRCVNWIRSEGLAVDIMGRGYDAFAQKSDGLAPYRFSVVIENSRERNYFTEKLLDAVLCQTVPIYWGCPNIGDFMDTRGMILCESEEDIKAAILASGQELYDEKLVGLKAAVPAAAHFADYYGRAAHALLNADGKKPG